MFYARFTDGSEVERLSRRSNRSPKMLGSTCEWVRRVN